MLYNDYIKYLNTYVCTYKHIQVFKHEGGYYTGGRWFQTLKGAKLHISKVMNVL